MQVHAERRPPLRPRLPAAREAVRRRQRLGQAQQLVDGHRHGRRTCSSPGDTPHENLQFLFFCAAVIAAVNKHQALLRASVANAGQDHRLGANEAPPAIISIFLGAELEKAFDGDRVGRRDTSREAASSAWARRCCRRCRCTAATATAPRRSPSPATSSSSARSGRACRSRFPNTVLNTIVAEAIDALSRRARERDQRRRVARGRGRSRSSRRPTTANKRIVFGGDNYSEEWHAEAEQRGLLNLRTTPDALPWIIDEQTVDGVRATTACSPSASSSRATRCSLEQYVDEAQHRGGDRGVDRADA